MIQEWEAFKNMELLPGEQEVEAPWQTRQTLDPTKERQAFQKPGFEN